VPKKTRVVQDVMMCSWARTVVASSSRSSTARRLAERVDRLYEGDEGHEPIAVSL
jgi:hypothetical protein